ncbi:MAG: ABC transporter ATP-binding protein [Desulfobacterales bacterium]|nr:ABC transporter ATP-binding protein [Desulfobacterales bacterium]MCP4159073.1 ABC transporter ATP-binding protein [Deltaproteobacteria bacterium]
MENLFKLNNLNFSYDKRKVLNNISLNIEQGSFYGILGPNGSGKSTLLDIITGYLRPASGSVSFKGRDIGKWSKKELSKEIGVVLQNFYINFGYTVKDIVMMGRHPHIKKFANPAEQDLRIVDDTIRKTDIEKFKDRLITNLSGGERQRVVFARALAQDTKVLILDEATSNLDINHTLKFMNLVSERVKNKNITVIAVIQDINLAAMFCDHLIFLKDGNLKAIGKKDDVLSSSNIKEIFNVDTNIEENIYSGSKQVAFKRSI